MEKGKWKSKFKKEFTGMGVYGGHLLPRVPVCLCSEGLWEPLGHLLETYSGQVSRVT